MLKKLHIAILLLLCGVVYMTQDGVQSWNLSDESAASRHSYEAHDSSRIFQYDNSSERYVDWNSPEMSATGTEVMPPSARGGSGTGRIHGSLKIPLRNPLCIWTGRAAVLTDRTGKMENNGNFYISDLKKQKIAFIFLSCGRGRSSGRSRRICSWIRNGF